MKTHNIFILTLITLVLTSMMVPKALFAIGVEVGMGRFYPDDTSFVDSGGWSFNLAVRIPQGSFMLIETGLELYMTKEDNMTFAELPTGVTSGSVNRKLIATGLHGAIGIGKFLGSSGVGVFPHASVGAGIMGITAITKWEYITQIHIPYDEKKSIFHGRPFFIGNCGIEATFMHIGVFFRVSYVIAKEVDYCGVDVIGYDAVLPGGSINPSGIVWFVGIALE
ncbi:hypothetical protein JXI42_14650 [bacterium]|nr:hypothetical protein [bacterium]